MAFRDVMKRLRTGAEESDLQVLADLPGSLGCTPITDVVDRQVVDIVGRVRSLRIVPRAGAPLLEVVVADGHGLAVGVFFGRRHIAGIHAGRTVRLTGRARVHRGRTTLINPAYELLS